MFRGERLHASTDFKIEAAEDLIGAEKLSFPNEAFAWELHTCAQFTERWLAKLLPETGACALSHADYLELYKRSAPAMWAAHVFRELNNHVRIDLVVGNADYSGYTRPTVMEAKRLGIPTLDIEHGYMAVRWEPDACQPNFPPEFLFISDYVNLDNEIEKQIWLKHGEQQPTRPQVTFLTHGTPNDISFEQTVARQAALQQLGLDQDKFTLTVASGWIEARLPTMAVKGHIEEVEYFQEVLQTVADFRDRDRLQIIIKLHPAYAPKAIFADARNCLQHLASELGVDIALISHAHLREVLAASDLIISPGCSSILWEGFLAFIPGIIYPYPNSFNQFRKEKLNSSNVLFRKGCLRYVFDRQDICDTIKHFLDPDNRAHYRKINHELRQEYQIRPATPEEKSQRICTWIQNTLKRPATRTIPLR